LAAADDDDLIVDLSSHRWALLWFIMPVGHAL